MNASELSKIASLHAESICRHLLPSGKRVHHEWCVGDLFGGTGRSLKIVLEGDKVGVWADFATGEVGGDILDLWQQTQRCSLREAVAQMSSYLHIVSDGEETRPKREYQRPNKEKIVKEVKRLDPHGKVYAYLKSRGLTDQALDEFRVSEENGEWIVFPYLREDGFINAKYIHIERDENNKKRCRQLNNAEPCLFGWHALERKYPNTREVTITEGECFTGDAQLLTPSGWIKIEDYSGDKIAQWNDGNVEFVSPFAFIKKHFDGELIEYETKQFYSLTTPGHKMVSIDHRGRSYFHTAQEGPKATQHYIPRCGILNGQGINLSNEQIALCIAISADASIDVRKGTYREGPPRKSGFSSRYARFGFKKSRKIHRLETITQALGIKISNNIIGNEYRSMCFGIPDWVPGRILPWDWIAQATFEQREFILRELIEWDGNKVPNRTMTEYSSKFIENAEWVQALAHTAGRCSTVVYRENQYGSWFKVTILNQKNRSSWQRVRLDCIKYDGNVYCVQVPSGAIMVRQRGIISISGNCDAITLHQCGVPALSVPNGGGGGRKQDWIENDFDRLANFDTIYLCMDDDPAGKEAEAEIVRRLGNERIRLVRLPHKDANECLKHNITDFQFFLRSAKSFDPSELKPAEYFTDQVLDKFYPTEGSYCGMRTPWNKVNEALKFDRAELIVWTGFSGSGKSQLLNHIAAQGMFDNEKFVICSLEMPGKVTLWRMVRQLTGQKIPTKERIENAMGWMRDKLWILDIIGTAKVDRILEVFKYAVKRYDIKNFIIDSLTKCGIAEDDYNGQKSFIDKLCDFAHQYQVTIHLVVHQRKPMNEDGRPGKFGVRGAAAITDEASTVISIWRRKADDDENGTRRGKKIDMENAPDAVLSIVKNRETGIEGKFGLYFDSDSLQYREDKNSTSNDYLGFPKEENVMVF